MAYKLLDFADIYTAVLEELKIPLNDTVEVARIKRDINSIYINEVVPFSRWKWLEGFTTVKVPQVYLDGTVDITFGNTTATLSTAPSVSLGSFKNKIFSLDSSAETYIITAHTAGSTTITIDHAFNGTTNSEATFKIWSDWVGLPTDCRETVEIWHDFDRQPLEGRGLQEFRKIQNATRKTQGRPIYTYTGDFIDPTSGTDETESDRYRALWVHPAIFTSATNLHVSYIKEVDALEDDGDEPVMPIEDRIVLLYGALARAWRRQRNPEASAENFQLFQNKLARMAGKVEDSFDKPQFKPDSLYISAKRGPRGSARSLAALGGTGTGGGTAAAVTYLQDVTINGANITGNVTVANDITIDGRDISDDGTTLDTVVSDLAAHLADTTDAHDASAISVIAQNGISSTDVQSALEEVQGDISSHLTDNTDAHDASAISVVAQNGIAATDVQAALEELQSEIDNLLDSSVFNVLITESYSNVGEETLPAAKRTVVMTRSMSTESQYLLVDSSTFSVGDIISVIPLEAYDTYGSGEGDIRLIESSNWDSGDPGGSPVITSGSTLNLTPFYFIYRGDGVWLTQYENRFDDLYLNSLYENDSQTKVADITSLDAQWFSGAVRYDSDAQATLQKDAAAAVGPIFNLMNKGGGGIGQIKFWTTDDPSFNGDAGAMWEGADDGDYGVDQYFYNIGEADLSNILSKTLGLIGKGKIVRIFSYDNNAVSHDLSVDSNGTLSFSDDVQFPAKIKLKETGGGSDTVDLQAAASSAAYTITLPAAAPTANTALAYDGSNYVWSSAGGWTTYANENISASGTVSNSTTVGQQYRRVTGNGAAVTLSTTPFGTAGTWSDGLVIRLVGGSSTNTVTIVHNDAANGAILDGDCTLGQYDTIELQWDSTASRWIEIARSVK